MPLLKSRTRRVIAIDNDAFAIAALRHQPALGLVRGDAIHLPVATSSFSAVVAFTMLHHIPTAALQQRLFREVSRFGLAACSSAWMCGSVLLCGCSTWGMTPIDHVYDAALHSYVGRHVAVREARMRRRGRHRVDVVWRTSPCGALAGQVLALVALWIESALARFLRARLCAGLRGPACERCEQVQTITCAHDGFQVNTTSWLK